MLTLARAPLFCLCSSLGLATTQGRVEPSARLSAEEWYLTGPKVGEPNCRWALRFRPQAYLPLEDAIMLLMKLLMKSSCCSRAAVCLYLITSAIHIS